MIDNSYYIILNRLKAFANGHYLINTFTYQDEADFDISKNPHYPIMHPIPVSINPKVGGITYNFDIIFADKPRQKENIAETKMNIISDMARCALDLGAEITNGNILFGSDISLDGEISIEPFTDEFANVLTGVRLQIAILVPYDWSACDIPANWVDGTGDIPDFGGRSLTMDIYDEGVFKVAAREMNFVGSGVTVTYTGNRAIVTINGGGGGGAVDSVNGQTGVVVLDASDVGADTAGSAAAALTSANSYTDAEIAALSKADVGLGNVDNTSDLNKPISTATQTALDNLNNYTEIIRAGATVATATTRWLVPGLSGFGTSAIVNIAEKAIHTTYRVVTGSAQPANGDMTITRIFSTPTGTVLQSDVLTIPAGAAIGAYEYTGDTFDATAIDCNVRFVFLNNGTSSSAFVQGLERTFTR